MMMRIDEQETFAQSPNNDSEAVLSVNGVSKKFCRNLKRSLLYGVQDIASEVLGLREESDKLRTQEFWALKDVSFQLRPGEALGLVGKNGSGKSTLLRIIAGLINPDTGSVEVRGRVAPLIALGAGFNPILTGRENIYANMSILGLSKKEIDERFDAVVDFAEIGEAIDAPVRSYSSGMAARLGFASAIFTEPDILLIDEVLAVGDAKFRTKCYQKLSKLRSLGTSFVLVTHSAPAIISICENSLYLSKGRLLANGDSNTIIKKYEQELFCTNNSNNSNAFVRSNSSQTSKAYIKAITWRSSANQILSSPSVGENVSLEIEMTSLEEFHQLSLNIMIRDLRSDSTVLHFISDRDGMKFDIPSGKSFIRLETPKFRLSAGFYVAKLTLSGPNFYVVDMVDDYRFSVLSGRKIDLLESLFFQERKWEIIRSTSPDSKKTEKL